MIIKINDQNPQKQLVKVVAEILNDDGVIVYPTDTVYGVGCSITSKSGVDRICQLKQRDDRKPLSFICRSLSEVSKYARLTDFAYNIMKDLLPGPFTFILSATKATPKFLQHKRRTVGVRIPESKICLDILEALGEPITSTSANISSEAIMSDIHDIKATFGNRVDLYVDGGVIVSDASTVVNLVNGEIEILRQGKGEI